MNPQTPSEPRPPEDSLEQSPADVSLSGDSLESGNPEVTSTPQAGQVLGPVGAAGGGAGSAGGPTNSSEKASRAHFIRALWEKLNLYLLLFILLIVVAVIAIIIAILRNNTNNNAANPSIGNQTLSESALKQLANSSATVGDPKQILNIESNAVFAGGVLVRGDLQVAGTIKAGGSLSLPGISVSGSSTFGEVQAKTLAIAGNAAVQGQLTVQSALSVNGGGTFNGPLTAPLVNATALQLNGTLTLNHHIAAGGPVPGRANGGALGGGGTSSVSGSDTAGSISIHTGSGPGPGCFAIINFSQAFSTTPHIIVTPIGAAAAGLAYYVDRSPTSFSVCTTSTPAAGQNFGFDYIAFD